ncbi:hypothetical protein K501DRAFT_281357 [Backusella circina FSU 941]|nr:hypothetical protein K501DRAFT_281357 [Backusella circina FSU 941]
MPNLTLDFRHLVETKATTIPKTSIKPRKEKQDDENGYDLFTKEAYRVYQHINSLGRFLVSIRPAYLSTSHRPSRNRKPTAVQMDKAAEGSLFSLFPSDISHLTDRERDEIDFQAKLIIRRCIDRIKELEESEKIRKENQTHKKNGILTQWFHSVLSSPAEDILSVHRSSMTWLLNQKLMEVSKLQKDQQEIRLEREIEKSENQLSKSNYAESLVTPSKTTTHVDESTPFDAFEEQLSAEQVQMLEKENSVMLEDLNNTLNQVKTAEKALIEISTLQTQLANHLAAQTIQTDKLYADAIATTETVERGNLQLISARERNKSSRKFMLAFLIGASFVLLFLDWYS